MISSCEADIDETAESLYLGRLDAVRAEAFRAHMATCPKCTKVYERNVAFVDAIRGAAKLLQQKRAIES